MDYNTLNNYHMIDFKRSEAPYSFWSVNRKSFRTSLVMDYQENRSVDIDTDFYGDPRERRLFHCKLFSTLVIQFVVVSVGSLASRNKQGIDRIAYNYAEYRLVFGFFGLLLLLLMLFIEKMRRFSPLNMIFIILITLAYTVTYTILIESMEFTLIYVSFVVSFLIAVFTLLLAVYVPINLTGNVRFSLMMNAGSFGFKLALTVTLVYIHSPLLFLVFVSICLVEAVFVFMYLFQYVWVQPKQTGEGVHHPLYFMKGDDKSCETRIGIACFAILSLFQVAYNLLLCTFFLALVILFQIV